MTPVTAELRDLASSLEDDLHVFNETLTGTNADQDQLNEETRRALRRLRFDVDLAATRIEAALTDRQTYTTIADEQLRALHGAIDLLRVRQSLAAATGRQEADRLLAAAENAWLAAKSRLDVARADASVALKDLRNQVDRLTSDAIAAVRDAAGAFRRTAASA